MEEEFSVLEHPASDLPPEGFNVVLGGEWEKVKEMVEKSWKMSCGKKSEEKGDLC